MGVDPVENFKKAKNQVGTVAFQNNEEQRILKGLNRHPFIAAIWSYYFPGGGFFYLGKPMIGCLHIILVFILIAAVISVKGLGVGEKILSVVGVYFGVECISFVVTFIVALVMHRKAERDWEIFMQQKNQQHQLSHESEQLPPAK